MQLARYWLYIGYPSRRLALYYHSTIISASVCVLHYMVCAVPIELVFLVVVTWIPYPNMQ
jgi:hypothetical protein